MVFDTPIKDVHGRYLAYLELEGVDLGKRMVEEGVSMVYTEYDFAREGDYLTAEWMASENRAGELAPAVTEVVGTCSAR